MAIVAETDGRGNLLGEAEEVSLAEAAELCRIGFYTLFDNWEVFIREFLKQEEDEGEYLEYEEEGDFLERREA